MKVKLILPIVALMLILTSCHRKNPAEGKMIFRYNEVAGIGTLDPAFAKDQARIWACSQLFNCLVRLDEDLDVKPSVAHSWTVSPDGKTYTFYLRQDVYFHKDKLFKNQQKTRHVVASDFVYSFNRILDTNVASPGLWIFSEVAPNGFSAPDDSTFVVRLKQPFAPFLSLLATPYCSVVPHEVVDHYGTDFRSHPVGTGPFQFQFWKEGVKLVLRKNPNYFETDEHGVRLPYLDAVATTFIIDKHTVFLEFVKGNLDFMNSLDASYKDELLTRTGQLKEKYRADIRMESLPFLNTEYLGFYMDTLDGQKVINPLHDRRIRQAINYGFDRRKMMKYLRNNIGYPGVYGFIPIGLPGGPNFKMAAADAENPNPQHYGFEYNPDRSRQLLAEAGYPGGKGLPPITLSATSSYLDLCRYIQQQLDLVGIKIKIDVNPPAALREQMAQGKSAWFRGSWIADYPDAENYLSLFYSPNHAPAGPNYTHYTSEAYDQLYKKAKAETNGQRRAAMYHQMDSLLMDEAPVVVLYYDQILHFTHPNVKGLKSNAMNALDLRYVTIDNTIKE